MGTGLDRAITVSSGGFNHAHKIFMKGCRWTKMIESPRTADKWTFNIFKAESVEEGQTLLIRSKDEL